MNFCCYSLKFFIQLKLVASYSTVGLIGSSDSDAFFVLFLFFCNFLRARRRGGSVYKGGSVKWAVKMLFLSEYLSRRLADRSVNTVQWRIIIGRSYSIGSSFECSVMNTVSSSLSSLRLRFSYISAALFL